MLAYALIVLSIAYAHGLRVNTTEGAVEGSAANDGKYFAFYGIPYAGPTSGQNRFKGPMPPAQRTKLLYANDSTMICAQPGRDQDGGIIGVEDCLTLNIFTSNVTTSKPVIVFLNSEEYTNTPTPRYSVRKFIENDVVFVNMNFRLSIFGFLCLGVQEAPGNAGLRDVIQGLKWIQANIANFGGSSNNITLMGHASGAAMVDILTLSPLTKNLVHKGIALSGSGLAPWAVAYDPIGYARLFAEKFGYSSKCLTGLAKHLIATDIKYLNTALNEFKFYNNTPLFAPCIENSNLNANDKVLAEPPINVLKSGSYSQIPFIYGYTTEEGSMRAEEAMSGWLDTMQTNFTDFLPVDLQFGNNKTDETKKIRDTYFSSGVVGFGTIQNYLDYEGDTLVRVSVIRTAKQRALTSKADVRLIEFGHVGSESSDWQYNMVPLSGAKHGAFVDYMFDQNTKDVSEDEIIRESFVQQLTAFAQDWQSVQNHSVLEDKVWPTITKYTTNYLHCCNKETSLNDTTSTLLYSKRQIDSHDRLMNFWDTLYSKYYIAPSKPNSSNETLSCKNTTLRVNTTEGLVEGSISFNGKYFMFHGIPYAGPTSGKNRFKGPLPPVRRSGLFHANDSSVICAQPEVGGIVGVEDCLTVNIFTSNATSSKPVIVFLNSGEYTHTYVPKYSVRTLIENDVVFVNMNFRLSIFGFLCLRVKEAPGNAGLRDVIQGLKWIKANIANFGGNPNNVILMGHSSGAAIVDLLTISPLTKDLVHKGIALSGSGLAPWAVAYDPVGYAEVLAAKLGLSSKSIANLANHLMNTDLNVLNTALREFKLYNNVPLFAPCIENPKINRKGRVIAEAPIDVLRSGKYNQIPFIYGYTTLEGTMRAEEAMSGWLNIMQTNFTDFLPVDLQFGNNKTVETTKIRNFYFGNNTVSLKTVGDYLKYEGDTLVLISVIKTAKQRALTSKTDVRLLEFGYVGSERSDWEYKQIPLTGAQHGAFLNYLFDYNPLRNSADEDVCKSMVSRIAAFAHDWRPNPAVNATNTGGWPAITKNTTAYLYYGDDKNTSINNTSTEMGEPRYNPHEKLMTFWETLYAKYYVTPNSSSSSVTLSSIFLVMVCQVLVTRV